MVAWKLVPTSPFDELVGRCFRTQEAGRLLDTERRETLCMEDEPSRNGVM